MPLLETSESFGCTKNTKWTMPELVITSPPAPQPDSIYFRLLRRISLDSDEIIKQYDTNVALDMAELIKTQTFTDPVTGERVTLSIAGLAVAIRQWAVTYIKAILDNEEYTSGEEYKTVEEFSSGGKPVK